MNEANVLSVFDGMACGMLAMQRAGIKVKRYVAYEIDKYAVQTSSHNFPMIEHRGDVFKADFTEFEGFDFLIGGSPCTYWSIAQNNNRETEASGMGWELFQQYVRALHEAKPRFFVYENNKSMSKAIRASIDEAFGFEAICINSALVSAQNRQRLYWVGKRNEDGTYSKVPIEQPEYLGILLKNVLESGTTWRDKAFCITSTEYKGSNPQQTLTKHRRTMVAEPVDYQIPDNCDVVITENSIRCQRRDKKHSTVQGSHVTFCDGKTQTVSPTHIPMVIEAQDGKTYQVYEVKDGHITINGKRYAIKLADGFYTIRKLTVRECMRLQTVPEWYSWPVSNTQAYKMLGNGWTVDVIAHLLNGCIKTNERN